MDRPEGGEALKKEEEAPARRGHGSKKGPVAGADAGTQRARGAQEGGQAERRQPRTAFQAQFS